MAGDAQARVGAINRFPVKSMLGEPLEQVVVGAGGVVGDRAYAVVDTTDGKVASAKNPGKWRTLLQCRARFGAEPEAGETPPVVVLTLPGGDEVASDDPGVHDSLSELLGRAVRLETAVTQPPVLDEVWPDDEDLEDIAPQDFIDGTRVGQTEDGEAISAIPMAMYAPAGTFFDLSTLHLLTTATLGRLQELEPEAGFDPRRYRPNVLVDTGSSTRPGFVENDWVGTTVALGDQARAEVVLPTMRCVMTTLAQDGLPADRATLRTIARHNRVEIPNFGTWACAGVYATVTTPGPVRLGDPVTVGPA